MKERIWAYITERGYGVFEWQNDRPGSTEYIRADIAAAQLAERDARIAELEAAQRWISVDERLPDVEVDVLCKCASGIVIAWLAPNVAQYGVRWLASRGEGSITHWMPLPPPPVTDVTP